MRIAIVGTGIAGMTAAFLLHREHELVVFEGGDHVGGHTHTHALPGAGRSGADLAVDTGFIVFNERTYPEFCALLRRLGVAWQDSDMSFSVHDEGTGLQYCGTSLNTLYCQRRNLLRPGFHRMVADILRFHREARALLAVASEPADPGPTLGTFVEAHGWSRGFREHYLLPMSAAIWSSDPRRMLDVPARWLFRFLDNHGMLSVDDRPQWLVIRGGSARYVEALTAGWRESIRLNTPVTSIARRAGHVEVTARGATERFDHVILACHANDALGMLDDASPEERAVLSAFGWQENDTVLHRDARLLPTVPAARASWNYHLPAGASGRPAVTYWMNRLQGLDTEQAYCVTLNRSDVIEPASVVRRLTYHHPVFSETAVAAQRRHAEISGVRRTHYCGAYWGWGFHEDGVKSALVVGRAFGVAP